jgi:hypothetical protein
MRRYRPRSVNGGGLYRTRRACSQACRSPNRSKWLTPNVEPRTSDRTPQPEQQHQHQVGGKDEGGPLGRLGHDARPAALEPRSGHHGVLNGEQRQ